MPRFHLLMSTVMLVASLGTFVSPNGGEAHTVPSMFGQAIVSPSYGTMTAPANTSGNVAYFDVYNSDWQAENYSVYCWYSGQVTSCNVPWSIYVDGYSYAYLDATFATGAAGSGGLNVSVGGFIGEGQGHYDVTVQDPRMASAIALASTGDFRDVSRCVSSCFEKTMSYSPPTYVSMDLSRAVTLVYRSNSAHPIGNVQFDVTENSTVPADIYKLQLQRQDGSFVTFLNNTQALFFQSGYAQGPVTRLAGAFDASSLPTGRYTYTAIVTSIWNSDGLQLSASSTVRVIVLNESGSPFGAGWTVSGVQRAYVQSDGVLVTDGSGSASFFSGACPPSGTCTFTSPSGDFSTFSQQGSNYHRVYRDGSDLTFWPDGREVMQTDRFGNIMFYTYGGPNGTLTMIEDPVVFMAIFGYEDGSGGWKVGSLRSIQTRRGTDSRNARIRSRPPDGRPFSITEHRGYWPMGCLPRNGTVWPSWAIGR